MEALVHFCNNVKHGFGILLSLAYMVYHYVFLTVNVAGTGAVMQLQDSDAAYAVGRAMATGGIYSYLLVAAWVLLVYNAYKLYSTNKTEGVK